MKKSSSRKSPSGKRRREFRRPAENTTLLAGGSAAGLLALFADGNSISPQLAAAVTGAIAVVPRIVSEFVSWFREDDEEVEGAGHNEEDEAPIKVPPAHRTSDGSLDLRDRMVRVETNVESLKERLNERIIELRDEVRSYASSNHESTPGTSGNKTTRGNSSKTTRRTSSKTTGQRVSGKRR